MADAYQLYASEQEKLQPPFPEDWLTDPDIYGRDFTVVGSLDGRRLYRTGLGALFEATVHAGQVTAIRIFTGDEARALWQRLGRQP